MYSTVRGEDFGGQMQSTVLICVLKSSVLDQHRFQMFHRLIIQNRRSFIIPIPSFCFFRPTTYKENNTNISISMGNDQGKSLFFFTYSGKTNKENKNIFEKETQTCLVSFPC
jgi:hypothetical protein